MMLNRATLLCLLVLEGPVFAFYPSPFIGGKRRTISFSLSSHDYLSSLSSGQGGEMMKKPQYAPVSWKPPQQQPVPVASPTESVSSKPSTDSRASFDYLSSIHSGRDTEVTTTVTSETTTIDSVSSYDYFASLRTGGSGSGSATVEQPPPQPAAAVSSPSLPPPPKAEEKEKEEEPPPPSPPVLEIPTLEPERFAGSIPVLSDQMLEIISLESTQVLENIPVESTQVRENIPVESTQVHENIPVASEQVFENIPLESSGQGYDAFPPFPMPDLGFEKPFPEPPKAIEIPPPLFENPTTTSSAFVPDFDALGGDPNAIAFFHAPLSVFAVEKLQIKGPRSNADIGEPYDATRGLVDLGTISAGSWWCSAGGWPSPTERDSTEVFFVLSGHGCLTDQDDTQHYFGPGDTVILPKGWSGRWDVLQDMHKIWFVHDHPYIEEKLRPIRAIVTHYPELGGANVIYDVGPTKVGIARSAPGTYAANIANTQCFHVLEGMMFLSNHDGTARRCMAGDTIVLPLEWTGRMDVIEATKTLWVEV